MPQKKKKQIKCILCGTQYSVNIDINIPYFIGHAFETHKEKLNEKLCFSGREAKIVEKLLQQIELDRLKMYWDFFLQYPKNGDDWRLKGATKDIKTFGSLINHILQTAQIGPKQTPIEQQETFIPDGYEDLQRGEELFNTMNVVAREKRIHAITKELRKNPRLKDATEEAIRNSAIAILKENLVNETDF